MQLRYSHGKGEPDGNVRVAQPGRDHRVVRSFVSGPLTATRKPAATQDNCVVKKLEPHPVHPCPERFELFAELSSEISGGAVAGDLSPGGIGVEPGPLLCGG